MLKENNTIARGQGPDALPSHVSLRYLAYLNLAILFKNETILILDINLRCLI